MFCFNVIAITLFVSVTLYNLYGNFQAKYWFQVYRFSSPLPPTTHPVDIYDKGDSDANRRGKNATPIDAYQARKSTVEEFLVEATVDVPNSELHKKQNARRAVRLARKELIERCPSIAANSMAKVGVGPGSLDIIISTANFTKKRIGEGGKHLVHTTVDPNATRNACEPRATVDNTFPTNELFWCDHASSKPCCVQSTKTPTWGECSPPSTSNNFCKCKNCYDYRHRRNSLLFNEVRQMMRSFENNGLFVKSEKHPQGIIRKIFIVYNEVSGNPAPTWLSQNNPHVVAVPHKTLWAAYGNVTGYPTSNRNAMAALLHHIPDLGPWFLYLEDDMYLNKLPKFQDNELYFTRDGRIVSYLDAKIHTRPNDGWKGAMWSANKALEERFGVRDSKSKSLVEGMEEVVIGNRMGESLHSPRMFNTCGLKELWRLWPAAYAATVARKHQHPEDFFTQSHFGMFMEDVGFGKNVYKKANCYEVRGSLTGYNEFVSSICKAWGGNRTQKKDRVDWLQLQGEGFSDEYVEGERSPRGDLRYAWQAIMEAMWTRPSEHETNHFGGQDYDAMDLKSQGIALCDAVLGM